MSEEKIEVCWCSKNFFEKVIDLKRFRKELIKKLLKIIVRCAKDDRKFYLILKVFENDFELVDSESPVVYCSKACTFAFVHCLAGHKFQEYPTMYFKITRFDGEEQPFYLSFTNNEILIERKEFPEVLSPEEIHDVFLAKDDVDVWEKLKQYMNKARKELVKELKHRNPDYFFLSMLQTGYKVFYIFQILKSKIYEIVNFLLKPIEKERVVKNLFLIVYQGKERDSEADYKYFIRKLGKLCRKLNISKAFITSSKEVLETIKRDERLNRCVKIYRILVDKDFVKDFLEGEVE